MSFSKIELFSIDENTHIVLFLDKLLCHLRIGVFKSSPWVLDLNSVDNLSNAAVLRRDWVR